MLRMKSTFPSLFHLKWKWHLTLCSIKIETDTHSEVWQLEILTMKMANTHRIQKTEDIADVQIVLFAAVKYYKIVNYLQSNLTFFPTDFKIF